MGYFAGNVAEFELCGFRLSIFRRSRRRGYRRGSWGFTIKYPVPKSFKDVLVGLVNHITPRTVVSRLFDQ